MSKDLKEAQANRLRLDQDLPGWREMLHENGNPKFAQDGTMLDDKGNRSIFDDLDDPDGTDTKLVEDLIPGDMVDLEGDTFADPDLCPAFECELCLVAGSEQETPKCIRIDFEGLNSIGFPPNHRVKIGGFDAEYAAAMKESAK
jgi:hypothetical protein